MSRIQLVAETPRAGKWNHRFIVSSTGDLSDSEVAKVVATARRNLQGEDYLAVSVKTAQSVSGRTGDEILVLTGIEVNKLSGIQRQQIMAQLEQRLAELAVLVTEKIDWEQEGQALLVKRVELANWEKDFKGLPIAKKVKPPVEKLPARKWHPGQLKLAGGVIGILLVLGLYFLIGSRLGSNSPQSSSIESPKSKGTSSGPAAAPNPSDSTATATQNSGEKSKPKNDAGEAGGEKSQTFFDKLKKEHKKNHFSSATCRQNKEELRNKLADTPFKKVPFFVCDVLEELESDRTLADFKGRLNDEKWCSSIEKFQGVGNSGISKQYPETKSVIDSFQQLLKPNKETLCSTNPTE